MKQPECRCPEPRVLLAMDCPHCHSQSEYERFERMFFDLEEGRGPKWVTKQWVQMQLAYWKQRAVG